MIKELLTKLKHKGTVQKVEAEKKYPGTNKHWTNVKVLGWENQSPSWVKPDETCVECKKVSFYTCISKRRKLEKSMEVLLNKKGDLITKDIEKVFATLTLVFNGKTCFQEFQSDKNLLKHI